MITIRRYNSGDSVTWDAFVDASKNGTFMLKRGYMDYHADRFEDYSLLFYNDDELVALLPASIHELELRSHGGLTYGGMICSYAVKQQMMLSLHLKHSTLKISQLLIKLTEIIKLLSRISPRHTQIR